MKRLPHFQTNNAFDGRTWLMNDSFPHNSHRGDLFLSNLSPKLKTQLQNRASLESTLEALTIKAQNAWPAIDLPPDDFICYVAGHAPTHIALQDFLAKTRIEDLYLAWACAQKNSHALLALEREHIPKLKGVLMKLCASQDKVEEYVQKLRDFLIVGSENREPAICKFSGLGSLHAWLAVVAVRMASKQLAEDKKLLPVADSEDQLLHVPEQAIDPELQFIKQSYRKAFKQAFREALHSLDEQQKKILKMQIFEQLNTFQIAAIFQVHRITVTRWLKATRETLLLRTKQNLMAALKIKPGEIDSILHLVQSNLDLTMRSVLIDNTKPLED